MRLHRLQGRPGVTLIEVLAAIFILGVGMLAVLVLFPLGALKMAKSLQDSRAGTIAANADAIAIMYDLRNDPTLVPYLRDGYSPGTGYTAAAVNGRGYPLIVDPYYAVQGYNKLGPTVIDRVSPPYANTQTLAEHWFTFLDDDGFDAGGYPMLRRQGRYTWAYLLKRSKSDIANTDLYVIVYSGRPIQTPVPEEAYAIAPGQPTRKGDTSIVLQWTNGTQDRPTLKRGGWVLDTTYKPGSGYIHAEPYKVMEMVNLPDSVDPNTGATVSQMQIDVQFTLRDSDLQQVVVLTNAVEVFERGNGRR